MEQLFERYASASSEVQKNLSIIEKRIKEEKEPDKLTVQSLTDSLDQLSAVWAEIVRYANEQMPGLVNFNDDASINAYRNAWNDYCHRHDSTCAVLKEFLCLYSSDQRYMDALRPALSRVESILSESAIDAVSPAEIQNYSLFLRGVKELPANNASLVYEIEDALYSAFPPIAVSGLLQGKYTLREAVSSDSDSIDDASNIPVTQAESVAACSKTEFPVPTADDSETDAHQREKTPQPDELSSSAAQDASPQQSPSNDARGEESTKFISPRLPICETKLPSEKKLTEIIRYCGPVLSFLLDTLSFSGLIDRARVYAYLTPKNSIESINNMLDRLERKGYLSVYELDGQEVLCFTRLMAECLEKKSLWSLLKRTLPVFSASKKNIFAARNEMDSSSFKLVLANARLYYSFLERINSSDEILALFPRTSHRSYDDNCAFSVELHREGSDVLRLLLVEPGMFTSADHDEYDGIICETDDLRSLEMSEVTDSVHYCVADRAYQWQDSSWEPLSLPPRQPEEDTASPLREATPDSQDVPPADSATGTERNASEPVLSASAPVTDIAPPIEVSQSESSDDIPDSLASFNSGNDIASSISHYRDIAIQSVIKGRMDVASVILRSLSLYDATKVGPVLHRFSLASGDPAYRGGKSVNDVRTAFDLPCGVDLAYDLLSAAAHLRMFFSGTVSDNPYYASDIAHLQNSLAYERYPQISSILFDLSKFSEKQQRGLDTYLLEKIINRNEKSDIQQSLQKKAEGILAMRLTESNHGSKQLKKNRDLLFGKDSNIYHALQAIRNGNHDKSLLSRISTIPDIDEYIDEYWDKAAKALKYGKSEPCTGGERRTLSRQLRDIFSLFEEYTQLTNIHSKEKGGQIEAAIQSIDAIRSNMQDVLDTPSSDTPETLEVRAADIVLRQALQDCLSRISGASDETMQQHSYYVELLKEPLVALETITEPYIELPDEEIFPFDFCERAAQYLNAPPHSWDDTINRLLNDRSVSRDGMDYGNLRILSEYLSETGHPDLVVNEKTISEKIAQAQSKENIIALGSYHLWQQDFDAQLELADGDGWFESDLASKVQYTNSLRRQQESYLSVNNYGFYGRAMLRILKRLDEKASELCRKYGDELSRLEDGRSSEELSHPIFDQIRHMIESKRFGAAESYMQLVRQNHLDIDEGSLRKGRFDEFINDLSGNLYKVAKQDRNNSKSLAKIYEEKHRNEMNSLYRSGLELLRQWPESQPKEERISALISELGLEVQKVEKKSTDQFTVTFCEPRGVIDYPYPIAAFGSSMYKIGLDVCYITGKRDDEALITTISDKLRFTHGDRQLLVLANFAVSLDIRRKLAHSLNKSFSGKCVILIDRCLILFLASIFKNDRWKSALRCALPFCVINPYFEDSKLEIPPEMFIGRQDEIRSIISPDGHNLLSGGRQLGKTAILQRARFQQDNPAENSWAVYVDIKDKNYAQASERICKALHYDGFFDGSRPDISDWDTLIGAIEQRLMGEKQREDKLLLLLDEADYLLKMIEGDGYKAFEQLKELQQITKGRFKFVMAGLHNVLRFSRDPLSGDSILPHFSCLTIKPLKFTDARELLEKPLSYLGFTIEPGQEDIIAQILYNTNYFPGLIQFYASRLIKNMLNNSSHLKNPPYRLTRDVLLRLLSDSEFRKLRRERLMMTLTVDEKDVVSYYFILANALAYCSYQDDSIMLNGATAQEIHTICLDLHPQCSLSELTDRQVEELLEELVGLNILRREGDGGKHHYLFSRSSFLEMLGDQHEVEDALITSLEKGANAK